MSALPKDAVVWAEIPVSDLDAAAQFYAKVTGHDLVQSDMGPQKIMMFNNTDPANGVAGHLYEGKPAPQGVGPTIHLAVSGAAEDAIQRVKQAGGEVVSDIVEIPSGRFAYCRDLDGNSFGIFTS